MSTVADTLHAFLQPHAAYLRSRGWRVDGAARGAVAMLGGGRSFDAVADIPFSRSLRDVGAHVRALRAIRALVGHDRYDLVHVHTPIASFVTRWALRDPASRPFLAYTAHGFHFAPGLPWWRNLTFHAAERIASRWCDGLIAINRTDLAAASRWPRPAGWARYLPGVGLDLDTYSRAAVLAAERAAARGALGLAAEVPFLVVVAELNRGKRHRDLLRALRQCRPGVHLAVLGAGPLRAPLERLAEDLGLGARVHFLGHVPDPRPFVAEATALVMPSEREGLPRCVMEAMGLETPVIGAAARGTADLLANGAGWLYPVGDVAALASAIEAVLVGTDVAPRVREARRRCAPMEVSAVAKALEGIYEDWLRDCDRGA